MTEVKIVGGKLAIKKEPAIKGEGKPAKYSYSIEQFGALLKLAKDAGLEVSTKVQRTKSVNSVTRAIIDDFIATQAKPKEA